MEKKKIITENQEKRCRMIGIAGSNTGVGCTHFSIMLTNYLAGYLRRKAILLEFNESGDLEKLEYVCTGQMGQKNPYRVLDADYYKYAGPEAVKEVLQRGYDDILIDFGSMQNGFRFQRMPSRSRRSAGNFFSVSCKNDIKGRFP